MDMTISDLVGALQSPHLPGAACVGRYDAFDAADSDPTSALAICASCPALARCREWAAAQTWPAGIVVAGHITQPRRRPARAAIPMLTREEQVDRVIQAWQKRVQDRRRQAKRRSSA